ncbi:MAG TPA: glycosyltransferase family 39 protein [bacterium]|nr:glycosyltransferase family 39 protein [bacterium]
MKRTALILFVAAFLLRAICIPFMNLLYDEAAYAWTAQNLAVNGGWLNLYGSNDLFFFPPLFNYIAALFIKLGVDRLYAVRIVTTLFSSGIPPLMYMLAVRSGLTERAGIIAAALFFVLPWGWHLSVAGMVETPWICLLLIAVYFLQGTLANGARRDLILSALTFGAALWMKETALGALPLFIFALRRDRRGMMIWSGLFALLFLPLFIQTLLPHQYDLFYEITTPLLLWNELSLDAIIQNWGIIYGAPLFPRIGWAASLSLFTLAVAALALISLRRAEWQDRFILRFAAGFLTIFVPFFMVFPKKFPYYLLPVQLFLSFFVARYLATRPRFAVIYGLIVLSFAVPAFLHFTDRAPDETAFREAFTLVEQEKAGARIGLTLPRMAEYVAERSGLRPHIVPVEWIPCQGKADACIFANDYLLTDSTFLMMLYCRQWPMSPETCDLPGLTAAKERMTLIRKWPQFNLYRLERATAPSAP